ncbi:aspartyl protease family protein [Candidatus Leptofilum sp.]|uniref:aspartyl protease family protein n=1 Tax=Candidatus Leptofilum sp. TaxID=3241576 RepID=UPI003B5ACEFA
MPNYDANLFDPPAPLAIVTLRVSKNRDNLAMVPMLLDSGADVTLIPATSANQLGLAVDDNEVYELMGFDGSRSLATAVRLEMLFLHKIFRGRFLLVDQEWGVLGRDILNLVSLSLDGPNLTWGEQRHSR